MNEKEFNKDAMITIDYTVQTPDGKLVSIPIALGDDIKKVIEDFKIIGGSLQTTTLKCLDIW